jgi:PHD/YefM family antitoxin component YafN of YafNO toxin-antitoxin module
MSGNTKDVTYPMKSLTKVPASDVKRRGWRGLMWTLREQGTVLVTNHDRPEAVILTADAYAELLDRAQQSDSRVESDLTLLRRRFDERLAALGKPDAGDRLRTVMQSPARLRGKVKAGHSY